MDNKTQKKWKIKRKLDMYVWWVLEGISSHVGVSGTSLVLVQLAVESVFSRVAGKQDVLGLTGFERAFRLSLSLFLSPSPGLRCQSEASHMYHRQPTLQKCLGLGAYEP